MGNGWGGSRRGSGAKRKGTAAQAASAPAQAATLPAAPRTRVLSFDDIMQLLNASSRRRTVKRTPENSPFKIPDYPKAAMPPTTMAMDSAIVSNNDWATQAWLAGAILDGAAGEGLAFPGYAYLAELAQRPEYRLMTEILATESTRKWIRFKAVGTNKKTEAEKNADADKLAGDLLDFRAARADLENPDDDDTGLTDAESNEKTEKIKELVDFLDDLNVRAAFCESSMHDGFFGRSHLYLDAGDTADTELKFPIGTGRDEITAGKVAKGFLKRLRTIEPVWCYPQNYNAQNPLAEGWYDPKQWYVMGREIHATRLLRSVARPVPDILKPAYSFGGLSLSQMAQPYVDIWLRTRSSVAELIHSFSVMVLQTDLQTILSAPGGDASGLLARVALFNAIRDNQGTYVVNKQTEDFKNVSTSLAGLHELQAQSFEHMAFIGRYPLVKFAGIQPSGLNASSDGEIRTFYDNVAAYQNAFYRPNLTTVVDIAMITLWGARDPEIVFEFVPLWSLSEKEEAEVRKVDAETDKIRIDSQIISPEEARTKVVTDPASPYNGLDPADLPEPPANPLLGGPGEPGGDDPGGGAPADGGFPKTPARAPSADGGASDAAIAGDEWREGDHPRGQPGNKGQFGPGGGGEGSKETKSGKSGESTTGTKAVSIAKSTRANADLKKQFVDYVAEVADPRVEDVPISDLLATQDTVNETGGASGDAPIVGIKDAAGKVHVVNGHHRIEQAIADGKTTIKARVVDDPKPAAIFKTKKDHAAHLLEKGTTAGELMDALGWPSISVPAMAKSLGMKLEKVKEGRKTTYRGTPMTAEERKAANLMPEGVRRSGGPAARDPNTFSLVEFIASKGGIDPKDALIGDVRSLIDGKNKFIPGFGTLIRPKGMRLDKLREAAVEAGYLQDADYSQQSTSTISDLLEALDQEVRGKHVYQQGQEGKETGEQEERTREENRRHHDERLDEELKASNIDPATLSDKQRARVLEIMEREGVTDPLEAVEREAMEWVNDEAEKGSVDRILDDIPGWDVPDDAGPASKPSGTAAPF